jgi:hypothetical protein
MAVAEGGVPSIKLIHHGNRAYRTIRHPAAPAMLDGMAMRWRCAAVNEV